VVLLGFEGLYRFVLVTNGVATATVGSSGVCVVASWGVRHCVLDSWGKAWFVTDGDGLKGVARVGTRLATAVGFEGLY
jgi:hypothetical protein